MLLACTANFERMAMLSKIPFVGKYFDFSEVFRLRSKLQQAHDSWGEFVLDDEDVEMVILLAKSSLTGSGAVDKVTGCTTTISTVMNKILYRLSQAYPEYFED
jgi:hypothetical protein